jgi:hypothetical protein
MTVEYSDSISSEEKLPDDAIVYWVLLRKTWIDKDTGMIQPDAFFLRKNKNEQGISVNIAKVYSPEQSAARFTNCYGVISLVVGNIRSLGLDVVRDSISHANIVGLPYREDNRVLAERFADLLAEQSVLVWQP